MSKSGKAPLTTSQDWIEESLRAHNYFRALHSCTPLVLNETLSEISQFYANHLLERSLRTLNLNGDGTVYFEHSSEARDAGIGENLYYSIMATPINPVPAHYAVLLWYEEIKDYDFAKARRKSNSSPKAMIGHLTQLLWNGTREMGTAFAAHKFRNNLTLVFVVANYYRQGNLVDPADPARLYLKNVPPPLKSEADLNAEIVSMNVQRWVSEFDKEQSPTSEAFRMSALKAHNYFRELHGSQPLRLNNDICRVSQLWADQLLERGLNSLNNDGFLRQSRVNFIAVQMCHMGEVTTLFISERKGVSADILVRNWYKQRENYRFDWGEPKDKFAKTENFQQIVWNASTEFCISTASRATDAGQYLTYVVANYYPGRMSLREERTRNVLPPQSEPDADLRFDEDAECGCSTVPTTILLIILIFAAIISVLIGVLLALRKYQVSWYHATMKFLRLRKY